jgi:uncharacterized protein
VRELTIRRSLVVMVAVALILVLPPLAAAGTIVTSGHGEVTADPDIVDIRFEVASLDSLPLAAVASTAEKYKSVQAALERLGIRQGDIVTTSFHVREKKEQNHRTGDIVSLGHEAIHAVKITIKDFTKIGSVVDAAMRAGATRLSGLDFRTTAAEALSEEALQAAVSRALQAATLMAKAAGGRLGALVEMNSEGYGANDVTGQAMAAGVPAVPIVIVPDKMIVRKRVSAKWEFVEQ